MPHALFQIGPGWFNESKGGAENVFYNLYRHLPASGFDVRGVVPGSRLPERETRRRITAFRVERTSQLQRAAIIRQIFRHSCVSQEIDLIASHFALYALPLLDCLRERPFVVHFHGPWASESRAEGQNRAASWVKYGIERVVYSRADRVIVLSEAFARIAIEDYGVPEAKLRIVPGGVDLAAFACPATRTEARAALGWCQSRPVLFAVRRLVRRMGVDRLIDAVRLLRDQNQDVELHIAGVGPERSALEARAAELCVADRVTFLGFVADGRLPWAYRAADLTIVPSTALEGFGLIVAESLAAGTPALVTPVGGLPEVVSGLSKTLVLSGTDAAALATGIAAALQNPASVPSAEACRAYARAHLDWAVMVPSIAQIYRELL
ncbi:glycosyltransferase family 4 protein [Paracraurococcus lichenis]|uniref:Glycosyltransferase family 4 protein n=1 Tax=Paracraurococcus lichenis TaxID=3064888 RepID=A0ABT9EAX9_9PROT|nr:glycosyltransferase family 4 protein [Paracraurococcus sp. LOR1-02]MDO9713368.1 glycosyltransferase family 4 protein [Paracraurococcus sp. LOR1-02]